MKPFLLLLNGPFGVGKNTAAELIAGKMNDVVIIDWDDINHGLFISDAKIKKQRRFKILLSLCKAALEAGHSVIIPNTICDPLKLEGLQQLAEQKQVTFYHYLLWAEIELIRRRFQPTNSKSATEESYERTVKELEAIKKNESVKLFNALETPAQLADEILTSIQA